MQESKQIEQHGKIAFFTPYYHQNRGNATTAKRIIAGLQKAGYEMEVFAYEEEYLTREQESKLKACDLVHILHFRRFTAWQQQTGYSITQPYILTSGGTDVNHDIFNETLAKEMEHLIENACVITVFSEDGQTKMKSVFNIEKDAIRIVPQSVWFPSKSQSESLTSFFSKSASPKFLLPAGLRKVKDVLYLLPALEQLRKDFPRLELVIIGVVLEEQVLREVLEAEKHYSWLQYKSEVTLADMANIYQTADFVLNTSISEGQPAALLEAMNFGKIVFARRNGGNESVIEHEKNGFLYTTDDDFLIAVKHVLDSKVLQQQVSFNAKKHIHTHHHIEGEINHYKLLYQHCMR